MDLPPVPLTFVSFVERAGGGKRTYIATSKVTTLEHELRDDAMESRASVSKALLASAESTEVLDSLWDDIIEEIEVDAARLLCWNNR
jgi:hypothetical protein